MVSRMRVNVSRSIRILCLKSSFFLFIKHYLFSVLVSHILQTKVFFNKIKINIPRKIDYLHRVLQKEIFFFIYIYIHTHNIYIFIHSNF